MPSPPRFPWSLPQFAILAAAVLGFACAGSGGASGSRQTLPAYSGESTKLFDDRIDSNAVGLADVVSKPRTDPALRARTQRAEAVARVRVQTVTVDSVGGKPAYHLSLAVVEPLARGRGLDDKSIDILVRSDSPAFGIIRWLDTRLIGRTFIGFFRRFAIADEAETRFHLSSDDSEVLAAVRDANTLREVSGK